MNNSSKSYAPEAMSGDAIIISAACKDARLMRALKLELERIGVHLCEYRAAELPLLLLVDADDYPALAGELRGAVRVIAWTRSRDLDGIDADGAEAVLHRPFLMDDLLLCVLSVLRREGMLERLVADRYESLNLGVLPAVGDGISHVHSAARAILLSESRRCVTVGTQSVALSPKEWIILKALHSKRGTAISRAELAELIGADGKANSVDVHVCHLRDKIESRTGERVFIAVRGVGYKMK